MTTNPGAQGTHRIPLRSALNVLHGVRYASETGTPLTHMLTIDLDWVEEIRDAGEVFALVRERIMRWWRYSRDRPGRALGPFMGVLVHANPGHRHAHWLFRLPPGIETTFLAVVVNRLAKVTDVTEERAADACQIKAAPGPGSLAKYLLKGIDPRFADHLFIEAVDEGFVRGRRTSVSRAISRSARREAGWVRRRRGARREAGCS